MKRSETGFTLIEVMVAIVLLALISLMVSRTLLSIITYNNFVETKNEALIWMQTVAEYLHKPELNLSSYTGSNHINRFSGLSELGASYKNYLIAGTTIIISPVDFTGDETDNLYQIDIIVNWQEDGKEKECMLSTIRYQ